MDKREDQTKGRLQNFQRLPRHLRDEPPRKVLPSDIQYRFGKDISKLTYADLVGGKGPNEEGQEEET